MIARLLTLVLLLSAPFLHAGVKEDLLAAIDALASQPNYAWSKIDAGRTAAGPHRGKVDRSGVNLAELHFEDADVTTVSRANHSFVKTAQGWKTAATLFSTNILAGPPEPAMRAALFASTFQSPAAEAKSLAERAVSFEALSDGRVRAVLAAASIKSFLPLIAPGRPEPRLENARGLATFLIDRGQLSRYVVEYSGLIKGPFGELDLTRTNTTEISAVGASRVDVPPELMQLLDAAK